MSELTILCSLDQSIIDKAKGFTGHIQKQPWFSPAIVLPKNARFIEVVRYDEALVDDLYDMVRVVSYKHGQTARGMLPYFDEIVERHNWHYWGPRRNRNRSIHDLVTGAFYAHRRYEQMTTWAALELYPYWYLNLYGSFDKSPFWTELDKKIIPANCEWAKMYWIRGNNNSFGFEVVSEARLERTDEKISEEPPITFYQGIDPVTGKLVETPLGVEPGFYKAITSPLEDYVKHFIRLAMVLPVSEEEEWC